MSHLRTQIDLVYSLLNHFFLKILTDQTHGVGLISVSGYLMLWN